MYTLTLLEDHPTPAWNRKNNLIIDIMRETVRLENNNTWTVLLVLWIKHVIGCNHFINTHMALCWKYKDQMARSGLRWNEMGVCSLETNYLAHMDYTKYLQDHRNTFSEWNPGFMSRSTIPSMRRKNILLGSRRAVRPEKSVVGITALVLKPDCILESPREFF